MLLVGNKIRNDEEMNFINKETPGLPVLGGMALDVKSRKLID
jgi:hypothetical protein